MNIQVICFLFFLAAMFCPSSDLLAMDAAPTPATGQQQATAYDDKGKEPATLESTQRQEIAQFEQRLIAQVQQFAPEPFMKKLLENGLAAARATNALSAYMQALDNALHAAIMSDNAGAAKFLIDHGATVNQKLLDLAVSHKCDRILVQTLWSAVTANAELASTMVAMCKSTDECETTPAPTVACSTKKEGPEIPFQTVSTDDEFVKYCSEDPQGQNWSCFGASLPEINYDDEPAKKSRKTGSFEDLVQLVQEPKTPENIAQTQRLLANATLTQKAKDDALLASISENDPETIILLLDHGANVHVGNEHAMQLAAGYGNIEVMKILLAYGADISGCYQNALDQAQAAEDFEMIEFLVTYNETKPDTASV